MREDPPHTLVPALVGLEISDAHTLAVDARVVLVDPDPGLQLPVTGVVTAQRPPAGTQVEPGDTVAVHVGFGTDDPGGGGGSPAPVGPAPQDPGASR
ncbi:PASTA domain-containing protein [Pseudonocardia sp.]|uniref:PASTA domain-containing protein n=1 Tax=Pseudonocardia sp. TaxID=60912 RepID=UPI0026216367|nr:PASTA domain-containing protein [Pseudonocardia sp.]